jgi:hypothetical protein
VLPGREAASMPIEQNFTAIRQKLTAISNFFKIPLLLLKIDSNTAIKISPLLGFIFR